MRLVDILLAFPGLILAIIIASYLGPIVDQCDDRHRHRRRSAQSAHRSRRVLSILTEDYIMAARVMGAGNWPNSAAACAPQCDGAADRLDLAVTVRRDSGGRRPEFLGLGTQPPDPSWGAMLQEGRRYMEDAWWMALYPGVGIMLAVLSFNLLGDGLRDILDPRLRGYQSSGSDR